jgi:hypothetical protein
MAGHRAGASYFFTFGNEDSAYIFRPARQSSKLCTMDKLMPVDITCGRQAKRLHSIRQRSHPGKSEFVRNVYGYAALAYGRQSPSCLTEILFKNKCSLIDKERRPIALGGSINSIDNDVRLKDTLLSTTAKNIAKWLSGYGKKVQAVYGRFPVGQNAPRKTSSARR